MCSQVVKVELLVVVRVVDTLSVGSVVAQWWRSGSLVLREA